jgi:YggT family protein
MSVIGTLLSAFTEILYMITFLYTWIIIISALISWVQPDPYNPIVQILYRLTEPVYKKIRSIIPTVFGGMDLTVIIALLLLKFFELFFLKLLSQFAQTI